MLILFLGLATIGSTGDRCDFEKDEEAVDQLSCPWMWMWMGGVGGRGEFEDAPYCFLAEFLQSLKLHDASERKHDLLMTVDGGREGLKSLDHLIKNRHDIDYLKRRL